MSASIRCPHCGSNVPENARFCPGCAAPRSHVERELRSASELTGVPYEELLERARTEDQKREPQPPVITSIYRQGMAKESGSASRGLLQGFGIVAAIGVAIIGIVMFQAIDSTLGGENDNRDTPSWIAALRGTPTDNTSSSSASTARNTHNVVYRVTITKNKNMSLTYRNGQGGTQQEDFKGSSWVANTWTKGYNMRPGSFASVSAQLGNQDGTITCQILVDGQVVRTSQSQGAYKIASCSGRVGRD